MRTHHGPSRLPVERSSHRGRPPEVAHSGLRDGDTVQLIRTPPSNGQPASYTYFSTDGRTSLFWLAALFAALVVGVARLRGLLALVALAFSAVMITQCMLSALLAGESGFWTALVGSSAIMFVVLYLTHGPSPAHQHRPGRDPRRNHGDRSHRHLRAPHQWTHRRA
jgi:hypothetical protein